MTIWSPLSSVVRLVPVVKYVRVTTEYGFVVVASCGLIVRVILTGSRRVRISVLVSSIGVMVDELPLYRVAKNV